jgi:hypothetical protein
MDFWPMRLLQAIYKWFCRCFRIGLPVYSLEAEVRLLDYLAYFHDASGFSSMIRLLSLRANTFVMKVGAAPLHLAAQSGSLSAISELVECGASIEVTTEVSQLSAVFIVGAVVWW